MEKSLPSIPAKRYFTIGEVSELCGVKPYVLRYWETEFSVIRPGKTRSQHRLYRRRDVEADAFGALGQAGDLVLPA